MRSDNKNILQTKECFRQECLKRLKKAASYNKLKKEHMVLQNLQYVLKSIPKNSVLLWYLPLKTEVNVSKLLPKVKQNHTVLVPFMQGVSFKVVKFRYPLFKKRFSIKEPNNSHLKFSSIDVMVVAVVGVDRDLRRIGFGKGMYDRFFESLKRRPLVIFGQLEECRTNSAVDSSHDIWADIYITPKKIIKQRGKYVNRDSVIRRNGRA